MRHIDILDGQAKVRAKTDEDAKFSFTFKPGSTSNTYNQTKNLDAP